MKQEYQELLQPYFAGVPFPEIEGEKPLISIITPYFNNLQYVKEFFDSVFAQTYTNWELLLLMTLPRTTRLRRLSMRMRNRASNSVDWGRTPALPWRELQLLPCLPVNMWSVSTRMTSCIPGFTGVTA